MFTFPLLTITAVLALVNVKSVMLTLPAMVNMLFPLPLMVAGPFKFISLLIVAPFML